MTNCAFISFFAWLLLAVGQVAFAQSSVISSDKHAANLAYAADYYHDEADLVTLERSASTNPADAGGLAKYYQLLFSDKQAKWSDMSDYLLNHDMGSLAQSGIYRIFYGGTKMAVPKARRTLDRRLVAAAIRYGTKGAIGGDPASQTYVANMLYDEVLRFTSVINALRAHLNAPALHGALEASSYIDLKNKSDRRLVYYAKQYCAYGFMLTQKAMKQGWPGAYQLASLYITKTPKYHISRNKIRMGQFLDYVGCGDRKIPGLTPYKATSISAEKGSVSSIFALYMQAKKDNNERQAERWRAELHRLAKGGDISAQVTLEQARQFGLMN